MKRGNQTEVVYVTESNRKRYKPLFLSQISNAPLLSVTKPKPAEHDSDSSDSDSNANSDSESDSEQQAATTSTTPTPTPTTSAGGKSSKRIKLAEKKRLPYTKSQTILILGDGNFSFSLALAKRLGGANITATSLDSEQEVIAKYGEETTAILNELAGLNVKIYHGVDATNLWDEEIPLLDTYDRIVFNFPHTGVPENETEACVKSNQQMLKEFFRTCVKKVAKGGEIHVTIKNTPPYSDKWDINAQAFANRKLRLKTTFPFDETLYPGYEHKCTSSRSLINNAANNTIRRSSNKTFVYDRKGDKLVVKKMVNIDGKKVMNSHLRNKNHRNKKKYEKMARTVNKAKKARRMNGGAQNNNNDNDE